jgi:hypothetical protein
MKVKLLTTISFFTYQLTISQTEKLLHGKVVSETILLKNVEIINKTSKTSTKTNEFGEFSILVNNNDSLISFAKDHLVKRLKITSNILEANNLIIHMIPKPEELEEIIILNKISTVKINQEEIKQIKLNKSRIKESKVKIIGYKEAIMPNGVDFIRLGKQIKYLFAKEKEIKSQTPVISFKELIATSISLDFFSKDLKLKTEEKELFIEFCDADPKSKLVTEHPNVLTTMDFLIAKNQEFLKMKMDSKN